jgi:hypothetical protein
METGFPWDHVHDVLTHLSSPAPMLHGALDSQGTSEADSQPRGDCASRPTVLPSPRILL